MPASVVLEVLMLSQELKEIQLLTLQQKQLLKLELVNVPLFINEGDKIKIDTASGSYMERVKE
jgi:elongation factor P